MCRYIKTSETVQNLQSAKIYMFYRLLWFVFEVLWLNKEMNVIPNDICVPYVFFLSCAQ